ncbi:TonB-dependent receptor plug domain-containing protein [Sutterella sp.]|uniref:TonB-dependent receptor plug domain-containing protein n=1 Tax=Sutterella sp. TaxID=1981025 RepID=UPI0026DEECD6|nr:TonB-dependent receptor plug domain-containing protein [Sutterella sp.]MDO5531793.1 TonB-dependent receptor plug domain-containing protein [Sutterella sp.]
MKTPLTEEKNFRLNAAALATALALSAAFPAAADETGGAGEVHRLEPVTVLEGEESTGRTVLTEAELRVLPTANTSVTDALRGESFVQFDYNSRSGALGAEITPAQISIRGGRNWENSFLINGLSNNNSTSPSGWDSTLQYSSSPVGDAQSIMLSTDLLDSVVVLSENIPAEYGDFAGGVIDSRIRDAQTDRWHVKTWIRHTRDSWAHQYWIPGSEEEANDQPTATDGLQKSFKKYWGGVTFDGPLFDGRLGALVSYQKTYASTPVWGSERTNYENHSSKREMDSFLLRLNTPDTEDFYVAGTLVYSPYEAELYAPLVRDGEWKQKGGGWAFTLNTRLTADLGTWTNDFGWNRSEVSIDASSNVMYTWLTNPELTNWPGWSTGETAHEGLQGDREITQDSFNLKSVYDFNPVDLGGSLHHFRGGFEGLYKRAKYDFEGFTMFASPLAYSGVTGSYADGIIEGEQFARSVTIRDPFQRTADYFTLALFAEDTVTFDRMTFRPGVRVSYDDMTGNVNVAPRFLANVDILNDRRFNLSGGFNRYYSGAILSHALQQSAPRTTITRQVDEDGYVHETRRTTGTSTYYDTRSLETPYSDEFTLGFSANVFDSVVRLQGVKREYRKQLKLTTVTSSDEYAYTATNAGSTDYWSITLSLEKAFDLGRFGRHRAELGITRSDLTTNGATWGDSYDENFSSSYSQDWVYLDDVLTAKSDIPMGNYNSDWVVTYTHEASFWENRLNATLWLRWESAADRLYQNGYARGSDGLRIYRFYTARSKQLFNADLAVNWDFLKAGDATLTLNFEVLNMFDRRNLVNTSTTSSASGTYMMGRQFFLGLTCTY